MILPNLPFSPSAPRRAAWKAVSAAGIKVPTVFRAGDKAKAEDMAQKCSAASGVPFVVTECIY